MALAFVRDLAPELYESMTRNQEVFDEMAVVHRGVHVTLAHNTFHRMARIDLLKALHAHCPRSASTSSSSAPTTSASSPTAICRRGRRRQQRDPHAPQEHFGPTLDERPNLLAWYGTTRLFDPLSLIFRQSEDGLAIAHTYRYSRTHSTFLVEVDPATFEAAGLDRMSEAQSLA